MPALYLSPRVSKTALNSFLSYFKEGEEELHTFSVYDNDECIIRLSLPPYEPTDKREIYSLSKSFCSTAIGILIDDGLLSLDDKVIDLFPEKCPPVISENLSEMKVRHVLSMNTGHAKCVMPSMSFTDDAVKGFLSEPVEYEPGTHFMYNTGATCLLSCIVTKITGETLLDFLTARLFQPLGITEARWSCVPSGYNEGGCGLHASLDDIAKLGQLYLHKGIYNGKRILSEKWVSGASSYISDNSENGDCDWGSGYGYQFWMNRRKGYRGDGAFGQFCLILPERNMVIAAQSETSKPQAMIDKIMELVYHLYDEDDETEVMVPAFLPACSAHQMSGLENNAYRFDQNPIGWTMLRLYYGEDDDTMHAIVSDGCDQYNISAGNGFWEENTIIAKRFKPKLVDLMSADKKERCRFVASYTAEENHIRMTVRYLNCPHRMFFDFSEDESGTLHLDITPRELLHEGSSSLTAKKFKAKACRQK